MLPGIGEIWRWAEFYRESQTGVWLPKFALVLGYTKGGDVVMRLLTSQETLRSKDGCSHDSIRPGFYVGVIDAAGRLHEPSWVDLREFDDIEEPYWTRIVEIGQATLESRIPRQMMCDILLCAISAPDTQKIQQAAMYDARAKLGCS